MVWYYQLKWLELLLKKQVAAYKTFIMFNAIADMKLSI